MIINFLIIIQIVMSVIDFFKNRFETKSVNENLPVFQPKQGNVVSRRIELNSKNEAEIRNCFIAFDVETTGLNPISDRIVEIGAVMFQGGKVVKTFSSLVNPEVRISNSASAINHITNDMLVKAPTEDVVYPKLIEFLDEALCGKIVMCAHNAKFDFDFLCNTLSRIGFDAEIVYVDTLRIARKYLDGLENYKQNTLEKYFGLVNSAAHRAASDAENCGKILLHLLDIADKSFEKEKLYFEQSKPSSQELEVCAYVQSVIADRGGNTELIRFRKNNSGYVDVSCVYNFLRFKFAKKGKYIIVKKNKHIEKLYITEQCTQSEGGNDYLRVYFSSPFDLNGEEISEYIYKEFSKCYESVDRSIKCGNYDKEEIEDSLNLMCSLKNEEIQLLLNVVRMQEYLPISIEDIIPPQISRSDVRISAIHKRVPLSKIQNAKNWNKGFEMGFPYWEKGESERKNGNLERAIEFFDEARIKGYNAPALYKSYALAYRQMKDYSNEIVILDEGIVRMPEQSSEWEARINKAINLLYAQQEKERKAIEKRKQDADRNLRTKNDVLDIKKPHGRAILQMDEDGNIIKEFETITAASQEVGVNSKSIREAAKGIQKHAGGFRWKYKA